MPKTQNRAVMIWLFLFAFIVAFLIVFGGFVRLTRSGLSVVEWNPISGVFPPIGAQAWLEEFAKYKLTPEFQLINSNMSLDQYQRIFYIEWLHRLIARLAGLVYAIPAFYFLFKGAIPRREFGVYFMMGLLFVGQGFMGWIMVASGLVDRPSVSHFSLTLHLLFALALFGLSLWTAFGHRFGFPDRARKVKWSPLSKLAAISLGALLIQISYGGMTAGLKAGYVSDTWPLMLGKWIPPGLFSAPLNLLESPQTIVFVHRWFAFLLFIAVLGFYFTARKQHYPREITSGLLWLLGLGGLQIFFGVLVVILHVKIELALLHQFTAVLLFALSVYFLHRLRALDFANAAG
jgi:cytochrome c oxidase assembly protein subunit 15